ncbi:MAG: hypothetical protein QNJ45_11385 [Ardenticatenaceae bacterium]|nr:hypothetical protein [Ardenticatenaceae bacterium]
MNIKTNRSVILMIAGLIVAAIAVAAAALSFGNAAEAQQPEMLEFDVAEDMSRFIFNQDIVFDDGFPADGSNFITRGYIYPAGTLTDGSGVNPDGSPEFPDQVIGEWICEGYMINDAAHATSGVWVFSTQFFQIGDKAGAQTITTTGYELADVGEAVARAITGGTGEYSDARGESEQVLLGLNASEGVNLRVKIMLNK